MPTAQVEGSLSICSRLVPNCLAADLPERSSPVFRALPIWPRFDPNVHLDFVTENHDVSIAIANHSQLLSPEVSHYRAKCRREDRPEITIKTKSYQVAHAAPGGRGPPSDGNAQGRRNKVGRSLVAHAAPGGHGPPSDGNAQGRWSAASRRGTKLAGHSLLMPRPEVTAHPATVMCKAGGTKSAGHSLLMPRPEVAAHPATAKRKAGGPRRPDAELIPNE